MDRNLRRTRDASPSRAGEKGVTYIEVMLAMAFMVVVLVGLLSAMATSNTGQEMAKRSTRSQAIARSLIEECQSVDYADVLDLDGDAVVTDDGHAGKIAVTSVSPGMVRIQVFVAKPSAQVTQTWLAGQTMEAFMALDRQRDSGVELVTLRAER